MDGRTERGYGILIISFVVLMSATPAKSELPSVVEEAETLRPGCWSLDLGMMYRDDPVDFGVEDRHFELSIPTARFSFGVGEYVEIQLQGALGVWMERLDGDHSLNSGDWTLATKVWFLVENKVRPSAAFLYSVKLPNGSDELGGATDETDFYAHLLLDKCLGDHVNAHLNLGLGILGNPFANAAQNDVFSWGLSLDYHAAEHHWLTLDLGGETGPKVDDDPKGVMLSYSHHGRRGAFYGAFGFGFGDDEEDFRAILGWRKAFRLKSPSKPERHGRGTARF